MLERGLEERKEDGGLSKKRCRGRGPMFPGNWRALPEILHGFGFAVNGRLPALSEDPRALAARAGDLS